MSTSQTILFVCGLSHTHHVVESFTLVFFTAFLIALPIALPSGGGIYTVKQSTCVCTVLMAAIPRVKLASACKGGKGETSLNARLSRITARVRGRRRA